MSQAIGIIELTSIAKGIEVCDLMLKSANIHLLISKTICPGKYLVIIGGDIGAVKQAVETGKQHSAHLLVDAIVLPNLHPSVLPAISGVHHVENRQAVGVVETWSVVACINAADQAAKSANITLVRIHMAYGIGGKCYQIFCGDISDVTTAVNVASHSAGESGLFINSSVIARPHQALWNQLVQGA